MDKVLTWGMVLLYVVLNACGALLIKYKVNQMGSVPFDKFGNTLAYFAQLFSSPVVLFALTAIIGSAAAWMIALSRLELSTAYPIAVSLNFLVVICCSLLIFNETLTVSKALGIFLIIISLYLIGPT